MPRLFTGLAVPGDIARDLEALRGGVPGARWIGPENFHITLRFIGDIDDALARDLTVALAAVRGTPFEIRLSGIGVFGARRPRAVWAGVEACAALTALQQRIEQVCVAAGLEPARRKYTPHVTLARLKGVNPGDAQTFAALHGLYRSASFRIEDFVLYSARPSRGGGPYVPEARYSLAPRPKPEIKDGGQTERR